MAFYPQFPQAAIYAYPMPFPNQEFYAMYPGGGGGNPNGGGGMDGPVYFDNNNHGGSPYHRKPGYNNRKESADSGISDYSLSSRKTSSTSTISNASSCMEEPGLDDVKEEVPMEEPDDELCEAVVQQVEFYFSDANITKDKFLLKHVKRNKEGFVSLKLISSFKRVKHLTKDWRQVAVAIEKKSKKLEVNDLKTKVRRLEILPEYDETTPSRTVVALNLPLERPTIEAVAELFGVCGDIVLVRILRPGNPIPADVKPFANKHPEMTAKVCALVEFERTEFAHKAVKDLSQDEDPEAMKVMELTAPPPKKTKPSESKKSGLLPMLRQPMSMQQVQLQPQRRFSHAGIGLQPQSQEAKRKISLYHNMKFSPIMEEQAAQQKKEFGLNPNAPSFSMHQQNQHHHQQRRSLIRSGYIPMESPPMMMMQPVLVPAPPRRLSAISTGQAELAVSGLALPPNVIRMPRGPDKSRGFQRWCKNRMQPAQQLPAEPKPPVVLRKSRAIPIVAPPAEEGKPVEKSADEDAAGAQPEVAAAAAVAEPEVEGAVGGAAAIAENSGDSGNEDEGHFSDHDLEPDISHENERTR